MIDVDSNLVRHPIISRNDALSPPFPLARLEPALHLLIQS